jgi:hypothetical protein
VVVKLPSIKVRCTLVVVLNCKKNKENEKVKCHHDVDNALNKYCDR